MFINYSNLNNDKLLALHSEKLGVDIAPGSILVLDVVSSFACVGVLTLVHYVDHPLVAVVGKESPISPQPLLVVRVGLCLKAKIRVVVQNLRFIVVFGPDVMQRGLEEQARCLMLQFEVLC